MDHSDRIIPLEGGHNFRDIGGYATGDGRHVARGLVYRSGTMSELSDRDHAVLDALDVRVICDFRSNAERKRRPSRLPEASSYDIWSRDHDMSAGDLVAAITGPDADPEYCRQTMVTAYRRLPLEQAESYRELFLRLADGPLPLVFHCSAGKDRTGIAAALLLEMLGVAREKVVEDYVLTNHFFERGCELIAKDPIGNRFSGVDPAIWAPLMRAEPEYLAAMFETIDGDYGSAEGFMRSELRLDSAVLDAIRGRLLI